MLPEKHFRWRAGEITRLEAFCDVVFGFALTLLVVSLEVPRNYEELLAVMRGFVPFAACFAQLTLIWRTHYRFSRRYGLEDSYTVLLNLVLLFLVLFYVYPLKFVFIIVFSQFSGAQPASIDWHESSVLMRVYAAGFAAVFFLFVLMYAHAYKLRRELQLTELEILETKASAQRSALVALTAVISFFVALRSPAAAGWVYCALWPFMRIHRSVFGRRIRVLSENANLE